MFFYTDEVYEARDFGSMDAREGEWRNCEFTRCRFRGVEMNESLVEGCTFVDCDFTGAILNASHYKESAFTNCLFTSANLFVVRFDNCKLVGSDFAGRIWMVSQLRAETGLIRICVMQI